MQMYNYLATKELNNEKNCIEKFMICITNLKPGFQNNISLSKVVLSLIYKSGKIYELFFVES